MLFHCEHVLRQHSKHEAVLAQARRDGVVLAGGHTDARRGWFVEPTLIEVTDPTSVYMVEEYFGPIIAVHVYADDAYDAMLDQMESVAAYALTGAVLAQDRAVIADATRRLRFAAGNFYVNDRPTGSIVGQQPFGGARASGTNDKAGSKFNLLRWSSPRAIKETMDAPTDYRYPHMG